VFDSTVPLVYFEAKRSFGSVWADRGIAHGQPLLDDRPRVGGPRGTLFWGRAPSLDLLLHDENPGQGSRHRHQHGDAGRVLVLEGGGGRLAPSQHDRCCLLGWSSARGRAPARAGRARESDGHLGVGQGGIRLHGRLSRCPGRGSRRLAGRRSRFCLLRGGRDDECLPDRRAGRGRDSSPDGGAESGIFREASAESGPAHH